jgi:thiamine biosynthesis lipoprotein
MSTVAERAGRHRFRAMGGECEVRIHVEPDGQPLAWLERVAEQLVDELEHEWSRFRPGSALCRLNRDPRPVVEVPPDLAALVDLAVAAWQVTGGRFDPTVADAVAAAGYDRTFAEVAARVAGNALAAGPTPGCGSIEVDLGHGTVSRPPGVHLDLGGIGKGRAADLVAVELCQLGAAGATVSLGGDVRAAGRSDSGSWQVAVADPFEAGRDLALVHLADGGVATSSTLGRRWQAQDGARHHLIDPATSAPSTSEVVAATVVAATCAWAEAIAKAVVVAGREAGAALVEDLGLAALVVDADGRATSHGSWGEVAA